MLDKIGVLFDITTKALSTDLTNKIDDNSKNMIKKLNDIDDKIENDVEEIKSDVAKQIKSNTNTLTDYLFDFKKKVEMVEKLRLTVSDSVETARQIVSDNKNNLVKIIDKVDTNK